MLHIYIYYSIYTYTTQHLYILHSSLQHGVHRRCVHAQWTIVLWQHANCNSLMRVRFSRCEWPCCEVCIDKHCTAIVLYLPVRIDSLSGLATPCNAGFKNEVIDIFRDMTVQP